MSNVLLLAFVILSVYLCAYDIRFIAPRVPALQVPGGRAFGYPKQ